ncbi:MAG: hypothetical protein WC729_22530 [Sphingomonas sp.]|uniref:hypothetical protein n=1 Tax=Sphingomonas sp. TaxID=28214 RepID=UPI00356677B0
MLMAAIDQGMAEAPGPSAKCPLASIPAIDAVRMLDALREDGLALLPAERSKLANAKALACL